MPPAPPVQLTVPLVQLVVPPAQPIPTERIQPAQMLQLNWPDFKPEVTGKPDEDTEVHLLRRNDWIDIYISRRCQSPALLSNTSRRGKIVV